MPVRSVPVRRRHDQYFNIELKTELPEQLHRNTTISPEQTSSECGICWDPLEYSNCITTNCGHAFCSTCVIASMKVVKEIYCRSPKSYPMTLSCAMCRAHVQQLISNDQASNTLLVNTQYIEINV